MASGERPRELREMTSSDAQHSPEDAAGALMEDGAIVIRGAVSKRGVLEAARAHVDSSLAAALSAAGELSTAPHDDSNPCGMDATGEEQDSEHRWFGNVQARSHRRDLKLQLAAPVAAVVQEMLSGIGGCLAEVLTPNAELCELAALVSDPGAPAQRIHPDTQIVQGNSHSGLCTAFLALQDISADMGPTEVAPRTHVAAAHDALAKDPALAFSPRQDDSWGQAQPAVLQAGDLLLMDSRAWHRGGANTPAKRRVLLYVSMQVPANAPVEECKPLGTYNVRDGRCHCHSKHDVPIGRHPNRCVPRKSLVGKRGFSDCLKELEKKGGEVQFNSRLPCWHRAAPGHVAPQGMRPRPSPPYRRATNIKPNLTLQSHWKFQEPTALAWMFNSTYLRDNSPHQGCIAVHIRWGDACIKGGSMGGAYFHRTCFPVESYLKQIERLVQLYGPRPVYLASDSQEVVQPLREGLKGIGGGMELMVQDMDRSKYKSNTHIDYRPKISGSTVTLEVLRDMYSMSGCDIFLGSMASTMYELAWKLAAGRKGYFPPFVSMETPMGDQHLWSTYAMYYPGGELYEKSNCKCYRAQDKARPKKCDCKGLL